MKAVIAVIAIFSIVSMIEARAGFGMPRGTIRNINKSILNYCNHIAHTKVQDNEIYSCFKINKGGCDKLDNYSKFAEIHSECIKNKNSECGVGIIIGLMMWVVIAIFGMR